MLTLREICEYDAWEDARDLGILPPQLDFVAADELESERQEEEDGKKRLYRRAG